LIDAFCGGGGFTSGFVAAGRFQTVFANDWNDAAIETYRANFDQKGEHTFNGDIVHFLETRGAEIPSADVVVGGPPCQGFSLLNKARQGDTRRDMWKPFLEIVRLSNASMFVMENVIQLLASHELQDLKEMARDLGFIYFEAKKLCAADFGVPEERYRCVVIASRLGPVSFPVPTHAAPDKCKPNLKPWRTVRDAIGDLSNMPVNGTEIRKELGPPLDLHFGRTPLPVTMERYLAVPPGGNRFDLQRNRPDITPGCWIRKTKGGTDLFGRLWWDRPSVTIRTEFFKPEKGRYLHPELHRPITHREAARIQSFPDSFVFIGSKTEIARQIGNAVPPLLAKAIAQTVAEHLNALESP
jgi:DNA (cytosine-5)-methyltransferase 1